MALKITPVPKMVYIDADKDAKRLLVTWKTLGLDKCVLVWKSASGDITRGWSVSSFDRDKHVMTHERLQKILDANPYIIFGLAERIPT